MSEVKVTGNGNVKIVFRAYIRQMWIDLHETKTKMIMRPMLHISSSSNTVYISPAPAEMLLL